MILQKFSEIFPKLCLRVWCENIDTCMKMETFEILQISAKWQQSAERARRITESQLQTTHHFWNNRQSPRALHWVAPVYHQHPIGEDSGVAVASLSTASLSSPRARPRGTSATGSARSSARWSAIGRPQCHQRSLRSPSSIDDRRGGPEVGFGMLVISKHETTSRRYRRRSNREACFHFSVCSDRSNYQGLRHEVCKVHSDDPPGSAF